MSVFHLLIETMVQTPVWQPWVSEGLGCTHPPALALHQETWDEIFGLVWNVCKFLLLEVPLTCQDVVQCLVVIVPQKWRQTTEPGSSRSRGKALQVTYSTDTSEALLTACRWWHRDSTCLWGMKQTHSWWLQELKTQVFQSWPSASPWVYTCQRHNTRNVRDTLTVVATITVGSPVQSNPVKQPGSQCLCWSCQKHVSYWHWEAGAAAWIRLYFRCS